MDAPRRPDPDLPAACTPIRAAFAGIASRIDPPPSVERMTEADRRDARHVHDRPATIRFAKELAP